MDGRKRRPWPHKRDPVLVMLGASRAHMFGLPCAHGDIRAHHAEVMVGDGNLFDPAPVIGVIEEIINLN